MTEERTKQTALAAYLRHWHFFEKILGCLVLLGVVALLACQLWLGQSNGRSDVWYGLDYAEALPAVQQTDGLWGSVTLDLQTYTELERALVLVNGVEAGRFTADSLTLRVYDGDLLELDCTAYSRLVSFHLSKASVGIDRAALQTELELCGERAIIGRIKFR
jgi:hypothetical protein